MSEKRIDQETEEDLRMLVILEGMEEVLEKGWCQGAMVKGDRVCLLGAIEKVMGQRELARAETGVVGRVKDVLVGVMLDGKWRWRGFSAGKNTIIVDWNDRPGRRKVQVMEMVRGAIGVMRERIGIRGE